MAKVRIAELLLSVLQPEPDPPRDPTPVLELRWEAPPTCPSADEVRAKVIELMQRPLGEDPSRRIVVDAVVSATAEGFSVDLQVQTDAGTSERTFDAPRCGDLLVPAAVVVAIAVDPHVDAPPSIMEPPPEPHGDPTVATPEPSPRTMPKAVPQVADRPPPRRARVEKATIGALAGLDVGTLPGLGGTIEGSLGLRLARSRVEIGAMHAFERTELRADDRGGAFRITAARARGCWEPHVRRTSFPICGGVDLGVVRARGAGVLVESSTHRKLWLALVAAASVVWSPVPRFGLLARAELVVGPVRRAFEVADQVFFTTGAVGTRVVAGVEVRLP